LPDHALSAAAIKQPVVLTPRFVERIWGAETLMPFFQSTGKKIGEVWLTAEDCQIEASPLTLGELTRAAPEAFSSGNDGFPLLIKLLFPREKLSVQVHPDDRQAKALGQPRGKTECWYILSAEPGAQVAVGFRERLKPEAVRSAIQDGSLESRLRMLPVRAGDMIFIDAGTIHAIGPGIVLLETQQYSDITYRLWDYGRPRELHVEEGLSVLRTHTAAGFVNPVPMGAFDRLLACPYFTVDRFRLRKDDQAELEAPQRLQIIVALNEGASLENTNGEGMPLPQAKAVLVPTVSDTCFLWAERDCEVIRIMPPTTKA
jgi:mannose-6-phosphate isomerase